MLSTAMISTFLCCSCEGADMQRTATKYIFNFLNFFNAYGSKI